MFIQEKRETFIFDNIAQLSKLIFHWKIKMLDKSYHFIKQINKWQENKKTLKLKIQ